MALVETLNSVRKAVVRVEREGLASAAHRNMGLARRYDRVSNNYDSVSYLLTQDPGDSEVNDDLEGIISQRRALGERLNQGVGRATKVILLSGLLGSHMIWEDKRVDNSRTEPTTIIKRPEFLPQR